MNLKKLKSYEKQFFMRYPGGFENPEMQEIAKKHKMPKMMDFVKSTFAKQNFDDVELLIANFTKLVGQSSMVSVFEKAKLRDHLKSMYHEDKQILCQGLYQLLHGKMQLGFEIIIDQLEKVKLAKWTILTALPVYYKPKKEYFIKPTTVKKIIHNFELDLVYKPLPSWSFYKNIRSHLDQMKKQVDARLSPSNAAFTGFLMMTME
ncbi:MAG TPA: hypothetical protein PKC21_05320 [Oligoflexia bacterium]|nr:hypothetical protein [Oligoflexia bacterium]HMR24756.1 hypothetical protein [Oligoflexia bacterium]